MKNIILITCVLIVNLSFSQKESNSIPNKILNFNVEENLYPANTFNIYPLEKIEKLYPIKSIRAANNSEGKFPFFSREDQLLFNLEKSVNNNSFVKEHKAKRINNNDFVNKVILKILQDKNIDTAHLENIVYLNGEENMNFYINYATDINKLIVVYQFKGKIQLQIGKDINDYMRKVLKTEIDKTVLNSLNVAVLSI